MRVLLTSLGDTITGVFLIGNNTIERAFINNDFDGVECRVKTTYLIPPVNSGQYFFDNFMHKIGVEYFTEVDPELIDPSILERG